jgi:hypothetical protein
MSTARKAGRLTYDRRLSAVSKTSRLTLVFGHLQKVASGNLRPEGAGGLSPGFQPWEPTTQSGAP